MKSTKMIINKLDFLDYVCKQVNLDSLSFLKVKNQRQFVHIFQSVKDFRIKKKCSYPIETLLIIIFLAKLFEDGESCTAIARYAHLKKEFLFCFFIWTLRIFMPDFLILAYVFAFF